MKTHLTFILILATVAATLWPGRMVAQTASAEADTLASRGVCPYVPAIAIGAAGLGVGVAAHKAWPHHYSVADMEVKGDRGTSEFQFVPLAMPWVLKAAGVPTRSGWGRMAVSQAVGVGLMAGSVKLIKDNVSSLRPDGSDARSFPSGHTAWAFLGATMAAHELAGTSAWYAMGAYGIATAVAVERVLDRHHYPADVMAGAGIGILSSELGYLIGDLVFGRRQLSLNGRDLRQNSNFSFLSLSTGLNLPLGKVRAGGTEVERMPALSAAFHGAWAIDDHWGLGLELGLLSTPLILNVAHERTYVKNLSALGITLMLQYVCVLSSRVSLTADAGVGYRKNFGLKVQDNALRAGSGTPVGRVDVGCVVRMAPRFSAKVSVGYEISHYKFTVSPSTAFHTTEAATCSGTSSALLFSLSSRYEF